MRHDAGTTAGQRRLSCSKVKAGRVVAALLEQEVKGTVQREDVSSRAFVYSGKHARRARKCASLRALPLACVCEVT